MPIKENNNTQNQLLEKLNNIEKMLKEKNQEDSILSFNQACEYLEMSKSYIYKLTMSGKIPHYKPLGKKLYFSKNELKKWVKTNIPDSKVNEGGE